MLHLYLALALAQDIPAKPTPPEPIRAVVAPVDIHCVSLDEACARLSSIYGIPVTARGDAARLISVHLEDAGFWDAVLAVCAAADVGLAPADGAQVTLGAQWELPAAAADGPVLVTARGAGVHGERRGTLDLDLRLLPGHELLGVSTPAFIGGRDHER